MNLAAGPSEEKNPMGQIADYRKKEEKKKKRQNPQIAKYTRNTIFYSFESEAKVEKFRNLLRFAFVVKSN